MDRKTFRKEVTLPTIRGMRKHGLSYGFEGDACLLKTTFSGTWVSNGGAPGFDLAYCLNTAARARLLHRYPEAREAISTARRARAMYFAGPSPSIWRRMSGPAGPHEGPAR